MTPAQDRKIREAQAVFVAAASRLLDEADEVRKERDRLLELIAQSEERKGGSHAK